MSVLEITRIHTPNAGEAGFASSTEDNARETVGANAKELFGP